jgi:hypothetical protein
MGGKISMRNFETPSETTDKKWIWTCEGYRESDNSPDNKSGKWIVRLPENVVDATWAKIHNLVDSGQLTCAKVVTKEGRKFRKHSEPHPFYVICVYVDDSYDEAEVRRVRELLREIGFTEKLRYKTDVATSSNKDEYLYEI